VGVGGWVRLSSVSEHAKAGRKRLKDSANCGQKVRKIQAAIYGQPRTQSFQAKCWIVGICRYHYVAFQGFIEYLADVKSSLEEIVHRAELKPADSGNGVRAVKTGAAIKMT